RGGGKQHLARFRARETYRRAAVLDREAACGHSFVWRERGVSVHHANALQVDVELVGRDLRERGSDALAKLDLAGEDGDSAVGIDAQPRIQHAVVGEAAREPRRRGLSEDVRIKRK